MQIPGHLTVALIQHRCLTLLSGKSIALEPILVSSLFPDLVDKTIGYLLHWMPHGRHYTHNLFSLIFLSSVVTVIWGKSAGRSWFVGHLGHLLADTKGIVPWFFPVKHYGIRPGRLRFRKRKMAREGLILAAVFTLYQLTR
ncbi:MAG: metal-dependent hydrolase [Chloroflexota bacterium]